MTKTLYLANPYGFSEQQRRLLLPPIVSSLEALGAIVWEPFSRNNQIDMSKPGWGPTMSLKPMSEMCVIVMASSLSLMAPHPMKG